jgi:hypothetical protein
MPHENAYAIKEKNVLIEHYIKSFRQFFYTPTPTPTLGLIYLRDRYLWAE